MGITVKWDNEGQTIIRWVFEGIWTKQDYHDVYKDLLNTLDTVSHKVHIILDMRAGHDLPRGFISTLRSEQLKQSHPNLGIMVSIGQNAFIRIFVNTFIKIYPPNIQRFYMADSDEQAYALLKKNS